MPIYEYQCKNCGNIKEVLHKIEEVPNLICTNCKHSNFKKLISSGSFKLNGDGWYDNGFKGKK